VPDESRKPFPPPDTVKASLPEWLAQLAALTKTGTPLPPALDSMESFQSGGLRTANRTISAALREGQSLPDAFRQANIPLSDADFIALEMAHDAARLDEVLLELSRWLGNDRHWRRKAIRALTYPTVVIHLAALLPVLPLWMNAGLLAALAYMFLALAPVYLIILVGVTCHLLQRHSGPLHLSIARWKLRLPLIGRAWHYEAATRFCSYFRSGLLSAARMNELLPLAGRASRNRWIESQFQKTAPTMDTGATLSEIFLRAGALPSTTLSLLTTGDQSGSLDTLVQSAQHHAEESSELYWNRTQTALSAIAYVWAVFLVLLAIAATLGPYYFLLYQLLDP
jgi:type II secretory pathway component PulF